MKKIVQMGKKVLREKASYIEPKDINSDYIQGVLHDMQDALATQNDGVALAAPQIGESLRIFVVAPFVFEEPKHESLVYINPVIIDQSKKTKLLHEGCLSCRWKVGDVPRHTEVSVRAFDQDGNEFVRHGEKLLAHIFQHEIDHLDGILFIDKAENLRDMTTEEIDEVLKGK